MSANSRWTVVIALQCHQQQSLQIYEVRCISVRAGVVERVLGQLLRRTFERLRVAGIRRKRCGRECAHQAVEGDEEGFAEGGWAFGEFLAETVFAAWEEGEGLVDDAVVFVDYGFVPVEGGDGWVGVCGVLGLAGGFVAVVACSSAPEGLGVCLLGSLRLVWLEVWIRLRNVSLGRR